jgi:cell division protein FtsB
MPPAQSATAAPRRKRGNGRTPPPRSRRTTARPAGRRIRWDKVGRVALLLVLVAVVGLYVQQGVSLVSVKGQADQQRGIVQRLITQNKQLERQQHALNDPATIQADARQLGMVMQGERPYVVTGLPGR